MSWDKFDKDVSWDQFDKHVSWDKFDKNEKLLAPDTLQHTKGFFHRQAGSQRRLRPPIRRPVQVCEFLDDRHHGGGNANATLSAAGRVEQGRLDVRNLCTMDDDACTTIQTLRHSSRLAAFQGA